jgi:NAD-dependent dihydropyrimidine dehydrogenase PreA subunit
VCWLPAKERQKIAAKRCLRHDYNITVDSERYILCVGCVDVCPCDCTQLIPLDEIESDKTVLDLSHIEQGAALVLDEAFFIPCGLCVSGCVKMYKNRRVKNAVKGDPSTPRLVQLLQQAGTDNNVSRQLWTVHFGADQDLFAIRGHECELHRCPFLIGGWISVLIK